MNGFLSDSRSSRMSECGGISSPLDGLLLRLRYDVDMKLRVAERRNHIRDGLPCRSSIGLQVNGSGAGELAFDLITDYIDVYSFAVEVTIPVLAHRHHRKLLS